jgi:hypothetical protein
MPRTKKTSALNDKASNGKASHGPVIRIASLKNPATGRGVLERVTADGRLGSRAAKKLGVKRVASWTEVEAATWAEATKLIRVGKGKTTRSVK